MLEVTIILWWLERRRSLGEHLNKSNSPKCYGKVGADMCSASASSEVHHNIMVNWEMRSARRALRAKRVTVILWWIGRREVLVEHSEQSNSPYCYGDIGAEECSASTSREAIHHDVTVKWGEICARRALRENQLTIILWWNVVRFCSASSLSRPIHHNIMVKWEQASARRAIWGEQFTVMSWWNRVRFVLAEHFERINSP